MQKISRYFNYIILIIFLNTICYSRISMDIDHSFSYYQELSLSEPIGNLVTVNDIINWFATQVDKIIFTAEKKQSYVIAKYTFIDTKPVGTLELYYDKENKCSQIVLQMIINGTYKTFYNDDAKKFLLMFINYNDEFNYYF
jgi:hypothetical protein